MVKFAHKAGATKRAHMRKMPKAHHAAPKPKKVAISPHDELHALLRVAYVRRVVG
jgi:hypothetical protein